MNANAPTTQKDSPNGLESSTEKTFHVVCHDCAEVEILTTWEAGANAVKRAHEGLSGHSVSKEVVDE